MSKGFLFRRLGRLIPCALRLSNNGNVELSNKHNIASFQDVYLNPFYWEALMHISFIPKNIFDLGANFGFFTSLCHQVFTYKNPDATFEFTLVEANKNLITVLEKNINSILPNQKINIKHGVAGPVESVFFSANKNNLLASSIASKGTEISPIDFSLLKKPDLLKIDIEGAEYLLFENYFDWVKSAKAIIIEFHYDDERLTKNREQLISSGFELQIDRLEGSGYKNQLWVKKEY